MAFSLRKMLSNISYFSKSGEQDSPGAYTRNETPHKRYISNEPMINIGFEAIEPDSTSKQANSLQLSESMYNRTAQKGSLSDTDLLNSNSVIKNSRSRKSLKIDIKKASQSAVESLPYTDSECIENTPKHIHLDCKSAELFSEKLKNFNFSQSFEFGISSESSDENLDIESLSEYSDTDVSLKEDDKSEIKMCRKVGSHCEGLVLSATPESFGDVELDRNEEERISLLLNYQMKFEKIECVLKNLLSEFQFHIEVSKVFRGKSLVSTLPTTDMSKVSKIWKQIPYTDNIKSDTATDAWNIVMEREDETTKLKFKQQLLSLKYCLENFINNHFQNLETDKVKNKKIKRSTTVELHKGKKVVKNMKISTKKRAKHFDFPDYRDAFLNLFNNNTENDKINSQTHIEDDRVRECLCCCHNNSLDQSDSGLTNKTDNSNQSITSSIGNFTLDSTTLSAYSESLDQVISYNSFQDTSLINTLLQKPAMERITFYVQVHSIQLKCDLTDESKNSITFYCPACELTEYEEDGLLKHILSQKHCEKIHFLYKTAYIKKCVASGKEIQPSTVLNPMRMYRDDNKIVCFGDAMFACSLCFENLIVGESILMAHCGNEIHLEHKKKFFEIFE